MKILIIEDEKVLAETIIVYLKQEGYICEWAANYDDAANKVSVYHYDCVLVDITLPGGNGLNIIKELKEKEADTGIIIISAKNAVDDKIAGLDLGADDYIAKPFHLSELNSRIKSVLRRRNFKGSNEIVFNEIKIVPEEMAVYVNNTVMDLTKKEYDLLLFFVSNQNRVVTKESIAEHLWGDNIDMSDTFDFIYSHIKNLRKKIMEHTENDYVKTIYGVGYKFA